MSNNVVVNFSGVVTRGAETWLNITQPIVAQVKQDANLYDVQQMIAYARSGVSAQTYQKEDCPVKITGKNTAVIDLPFFVFPSSMNLSFSLDAGIGTISNLKTVEEQRTISVIIPEQKEVELGFLISDYSIEWVTPAFDGGAEVAKPTLEIVNGVLVAEKKVFGIVEITGKAIGYKYNLSISLVGWDQNKISNLHETIIATWNNNGAVETQTLDIVFPDCVEQILSYCDGDENFIADSGTVTTPGETHPVIYYNDCSGQILAIRYEE